jgi:hypothetical protein
MQIAIIGAKYENDLDLNKFRVQVKEVLKKYNVKEIDDTYFETQREEDMIKPKTTLNKIEKILFKSDAVIVEATRRSEGIGIITGLAISMNKPVLILYNKEIRKGKISSIALAASSSKRVDVAEYSDADLESHLEKFIKKAIELTVSKFYINLPPEINKYLEWNANHFRVPKVDRIRKLIQEDMKQNEEWQDILKD